MKRVIAFILSVVLVISFFSFLAFAEETDDNETEHPSVEITVDEELIDTEDEYADYNAPRVYLGMGYFCYIGEISTGNILVTDQTPLTDKIEAEDIQFNGITGKAEIIRVVPTYVSEEPGSCYYMYNFAYRGISVGKVEVVIGPAVADSCGNMNWPVRQTIFVSPLPKDIHRPVNISDFFDSTLPDLRNYLYNLISQIVLVPVALITNTINRAKGRYY